MLMLNVLKDSVEYLKATLTNINGKYHYNVREGGNPGWVISIGVSDLIFKKELSERIEEVELSGDRYTIIPIKAYGKKITDVRNNQIYFIGLETYKEDDGFICMFGNPFDAFESDIIFSANNCVEVYDVGVRYQNGHRIDIPFVKLRPNGHIKFETMFNNNKLEKCYSYDEVLLMIK